MVLTERFISKVRLSESEGEENPSIHMYNKFPFLKLVFVYVLSENEQVIALRRVLLVPGCLLVSEMNDLVHRLFEGNIRYTIRREGEIRVKKVFLKTEEGMEEYGGVADLRIDDLEVCEDEMVKFVLVIEDGV